MKLLVTGGAGCIGSVVTAQLLSAGHEVVVPDDLSAGHEDPVPEGAELVVGSTADPSEALDRGVEAVLHFAAKSLVAESVERPELYPTSPAKECIRGIPDQRFYSGSDHG